MLKFFSQRVFSGVVITNEDPSFLNVLKKQYQREYQCTEKVKAFIQKEYGYDLSEDEMIYLTIHIKRMANN